MLAKPRTAPLNGVVTTQATAGLEALDFATSATLRILKYITHNFTINRDNRRLNFSYCETNRNALSGFADTEKFPRIFIN